MSRKSITLHTKRKTANIRKQTQEGKSDYENQKAGGYLLQKIGNTHYLLPYGQKIADQQRGMELNETARILWEALETPKTMEELQQKMILLL